MQSARRDGSAVRNAAYAAASGAAPAAQPQAVFEPLEGRTLMSAVLLTDGVLTLTGDEARTNILRVDYNGGTNVTAIANGVYRTVPVNQITSVRITGGAAIDRIRVSRFFKGPTLIQGGAGNDNIFGGSGPDTIYGGAGNDTISGRAGKDMLVGGSGYDTLTGTRGVDVMVQGDSTPTDPVVPPVTPPVNGAPPPVQVTEFGAKADGVADDWPAIQAAIDAAPSGSTINFAPGTYRLSHGLMVTRPMNLVGNGSLLVLDNPKLIRMRQISFVSPTSRVQTTWFAGVEAGQQTFKVSVPREELAAGDMVFLELGQDPYDPNMPNFSTVCTVLENTGSSVTVDRPIPYGFGRGATLANRISRVTSMVENSSARGFRFNHTEGTVPDAAVWVQRARNVQVEDMSGRVANMAVVVESQDVTLRNLQADVTVPHLQAGRLLSMWQTDRVQMFDAHVRTVTDQPVIFLESWCRDTLMDGLVIDWAVPTQAKSNVIHWGAGSYGIYADNVTIYNTTPVNVVGSGATPVDYHFGSLEVTGPVVHLPVDLTSKLTVGGKVMTEIATVHKEVAIQPSAELKIPLVDNALVRQVKVTISSKTGVRSVMLLSAQNKGANLTADLKAGTPLAVAGAGLMGSLFPFNDMEGSEKSLWIYTGPEVVAGTKVTIDVEYYKM